VRNALSALFVAAAAACSRPDAPADAAPAATGSAALAPWSRNAAPAVSAPTGDAGPAVVQTASPDALNEILAAAPAEHPAPTGEDGGTKIATSTGVRRAEPSAEPLAPEAAPPKKPQVGIGTLTLEPEMASPAVEREGRAQLYWSLVQRCRDKDGKILPPDVITLHFTIDAEGYIQPATILATASNPRYEEAAHCMLRELSAASFRAPPSARGIVAPVTATVPSVD